MLKIAATQIAQFFVPKGVGNGSEISMWWTRPGFPSRWFLDSFEKRATKDMPCHAMGNMEPNKNATEKTKQNAGILC